MKIEKNTVLTFGKHKGKTLLEIADQDPNYVVWLHEETLHELPYDLVTACELSSDDFEHDYWGDR